MEIWNAPVVRPGRSMIWADIRSPFESFVPAVRHKVHSGAALEEHPQKNKCGRPRFLGPAAFVSEEKVLTVVAPVAVPFEAPFAALCRRQISNPESARGITEEELVLTSRVR